MFPSFSVQYLALYVFAGHHFADFGYGFLDWSACAHRHCGGGCEGYLIFGYWVDAGYCDDGSRCCCLLDDFRFHGGWVGYEPVAFSPARVLPECRFAASRRFV